MKIMEELLKEPHKACTAAEIKAVPYTTAHYGMEDMAGKDILKKHKSGKSIIYTPNYGSLSAFKIAVFYENTRAERLLNRAPLLRNIAEDLISISSGMISEFVVSIILFGSYAKGAETKESDIDVLFIIRKGTKANYRKWLGEIREVCRRISERHAKKISPFILAASDFREGLAKNQALVTEVYRNHVILAGAEFYIKEVFEWLRTKEIP